jgi:hypothetical protein
MFLDLKKIIVASAVAGTLIIQVILSVPSIIYLANFNEFNFSYNQYLVNIAPTLFIYILILATFFCLIPRKLQLFSSMIVLMIFVITVFWIQANIFVWNYGVLNGEAIPWLEFKSRSLIELSAYGILIAVFIWFRKEIFNKSVTFMLMICLVQLINIIYLYFSFGYSNYENNSSYSIARNNEYVFSKDKNVVVMVLDTFETPLFKKLLTQQPHYKNILDGFVFFSNTMSAFPTTTASIPNILTSKVYKNNEPFKSFMQKAYNSDDSLFRKLKEKNFITETYSSDSVWLSKNLQDNLIDGIFAFDNRLFQASLFRVLPQSFKEIFYKNFWAMDFKIFLFSSPESQIKHYKKRKSADFPPQYKNFSDRRNLIPKYEFNQLMTVERKKPVFKFFHYPGPHAMNYEDSLAKSRNDSAVHSMEIVSAMISALKRNGIYDDTVIIILADHGPHRSTPTTINFNPILLVKPINSRRIFEESSSPMVLGDIPQLVINILNNPTNSQIELDKGIESNRLRKCYHYVWSNTSWQRNYLPPMTELFLEGGNIQNATLKPTGITYSDKTIKNNRSVSVGNIIDFKDEQSKKYASKGWELTSDGLSLSEKSRPAFLLFYLTGWPEIKSSLKVVINYKLPSNPNRRKSFKINGTLFELADSKEASSIEYFIPNNALKQDLGELYFRFEKCPGMIIQSIQFLHPDS